MELPPFTVVAEIVAHSENRLTAFDLWKIAERASQLVGMDPHKWTNESFADGGKLILVFGFQSEEQALEAHHKLESLPEEFGGWRHSPLGRLVISRRAAIPNLEIRLS